MWCLLMCGLGIITFTYSCICLPLKSRGLFHHLSSFVNTCELPQISEGAIVPKKSVWVCICIVPCMRMLMRICMCMRMCILEVLKSMGNPLSHCLIIAKAFK